MHFERIRSWWQKLAPPQALHSSLRRLCTQYHLLHFRSPRHTRCSHGPFLPEPDLMRYIFRGTRSSFSTGAFGTRFALSFPALCPPPPLITAAPAPFVSAARARCSSAMRFWYAAYSSKWEMAVGQRMVRTAGRLALSSSHSRHCSSVSSTSLSCFAGRLLI